MFNMYQELADRIDELLKEREVLKKRVDILESIIAKIPITYINRLDENERLLSLKIYLKKKGQNKVGENK